MPGLPTGLAPAAAAQRFRAGLVNGESDEGGREEFCEFSPSRCFNSATSACNVATSACNAAITDAWLATKAVSSS
jgi:hypothetical protein